MRTRVHKWGNSLAVRIPKPIAEQTGIEENGSIEVVVANGNLIIRPIPPAYTLDELLAEVTPANLHAAVETGRPVGTEAW